MGETLLTNLINRGRERKALCSEGNKGKGHLLIEFNHINLFRDATYIQVIIHFYQI